MCITATPCSPTLMRRSFHGYIRIKCVLDSGIWKVLDIYTNTSSIAINHKYFRAIELMRSLLWASAAAKYQDFLLILRIAMSHQKYWKITFFRSSWKSSCSRFEKKNTNRLSMERAYWWSEPVQLVACIFSWRPHRISWMIY